jgi:hypothetical protein
LSRVGIAPLETIKMPATSGHFSWRRKNLPGRTGTPARLCRDGQECPSYTGGRLFSRCCLGLRPEPAPICPRPFARPSPPNRYSLESSLSLAVGHGVREGRIQYRRGTMVDRESALPNAADAGFQGVRIL